MKELVAMMNDAMTRTLEEVIFGEEGESSDSNAKVFDPVVFWCVNAIWMTVLAGVLIWIWKCGGAECLTSSVRRDSDAAYRRRLAQRQRAELEKRMVSPEKRRKLLMEYFRTNKVHMVVGENDIIQETFDGATPDENKDDTATPVSGSFEFDIEAGSDAGSVTEDVVNVDVDVMNLEPSSDSDKEEIEEEAPSCLEIETAVGLDDSVRSSTSRESALLSKMGNSIASAMDGSIKSMVGGLDASIKSFMGGALDQSTRSIDQGFLVLPNTTQVPNCCAVCLGTYEVGEDVVWSDNCLHAFHEECVTAWLIKMQEGNPCPCCRSVFVDVDAVKPKTEKSVASVPRNVMNFGVIRL